MDIILELEKPFNGNFVALPTHEFYFAKIHKIEIKARRREFERELEKNERFLWKIRGCRNSLGERLQEKICRLEEIIDEIDAYAACESHVFFATIVERGREALKWT